MHAKGGLLSITPQEILLDLGPLTSWPCPRHRDLTYQRWLSPSDAERWANHEEEIKLNEEC